MAQTALHEDGELYSAYTVTHPLAVVLSSKLLPMEMMEIGEMAASARPKVSSKNIIYNHANTFVLPK